MKILIKIYNWIIKMAKKVLKLDIDSGAESWGSVDADNVVLDTTNFDKNLDTTITDVQKLADAVDDLDLGGTQIQSDWNQYDETQTDYIRNKPTMSDFQVSKSLYITGYSDSNGLITVTNDQLGLDGIDLTTVPIIGVATMYDSSNYAGFIIYPDRLETAFAADTQFFATIIIEDYTLANGGGGALPEGTENQTLRYNENNELESNSVLSINAEAGNVNIDATLFVDKMTSSFSDILLQVKSRSVDILSGTWFTITADGKVNINTLSGTGTRPLVALEDGTIAVGEGSGRNYIEFTSNPLAAVSDAYAFSNTRLGLDGVNLNEKIKMAQCYVIQADYPNVKNNELVMGHNIEDGQISVRLNFNLAIGDRIKIYLEYID